MADPLEIAKLAVYLASDDSAYVVGADFLIDGGVTAISAWAPEPRRRESNLGQLLYADEDRRVRDQEPRRIWLSYL